MADNKVTKVNNDMMIGEEMPSPTSISSKYPSGNVIVRLSRRKINDMPALQAGCAKSIGILNDAQARGLALRLSNEDKEYFFTELIRGWNGDGKALDRQLEHEFLRDFSVKLRDEDNIINRNTLLGQFQWLVLSNHKEIANGTEEMKKKPQAKWVMIDEEVEAVVKYARTSVKKLAYQSLVNLKTKADKVEFLKLFGENVEGMSDIVIENRLDEKAEMESQKVVNFIEDVSKDKAERIILFDGKLYGVLKEEENGIFFGNQSIGINDDYAIATLKDAKKQDIKIAIMKHIKEVRDKNPR